MKDVPGFIKAVQEKPHSLSLLSSSLSHSPSFYLSLSSSPSVSVWAEWWIWLQTKSINMFIPGSWYHLWRFYYSNAPLTCFSYEPWVKSVNLVRFSQFLSLSLCVCFCGVCSVWVCAALKAEPSPRPLEEDLLHLDHHHVGHGAAHHRAGTRPTRPQCQYQALSWNSYLQVKPLAPRGCVLWICTPGS